MGATGVLVVDDDEAIRELLADFLEGTGFIVFTAPHGQAALERLRMHPERLVVLLDLMMPVMDGYTFLQVVAAESPLATQHRYILMSATAKTLPTPVAQLLTPLKMTVLHKPFELNEVLLVVDIAANQLP